MGNVHIYTATDQAFGDHAVYDIDQAVLVMTGHDLHIITPQQTMSARDTMEYWSQKHMAVGRGNAVVNTSDGRRLTGDVLVGYTEDPNATPAAGPVQKAAAAPPAKPGTDPLANAGGKLQRVDAFGHVEVRTATEIIHADKGVYVPDTGIARLAGNVHLTRGQNQLNGDQAVINLRTGVSTLSRNPGQRVEGLVVPGDTQTKDTTPGAAKTRQARRTSEVSASLRVIDGGAGLTANGVGKTYKKRPVVRNVSVNVRRGEAVGLLGPNGAGKTTTFYMIVGLVRPDTGSISLDGHDITNLPMYRRARLGIGYLPQEASVFRGLTVEGNIMAALEVVEPDGDKRDLMLDELLAEFGIGHLRRTPALALSGGERRRVEIARALATQPGYILLDEPLAGIDPIAVGEIRDLVGHLKDRGIGVLITDHNVRETLEIIDRAYIMHDGQLLMEGRPEEGREARRCAARVPWGKIQPVGSRIMAIGPRLEFRQSQSLVMTPQLRQAIKLLQFSNMEVAAYIEEELERNPLLERDEKVEGVPERPAPDQRIEALDHMDTADLLRREKLPDAAEADHTNSYDAGSLSDGAAAFSREGGGGRGFDGDDRGMDDLAEAPRSLRSI